MSKRSKKTQPKDPHQDQEVVFGKFKIIVRPVEDYHFLDVYRRNGPGPSDWRPVFVIVGRTGPLSLLGVLEDVLTSTIAVADRAVNPITLAESENV